MAQPEASPEVQAADPKLRRIVLAALALVVVAATVLVVRLDAYLISLQAASKGDLVNAAAKVSRLGNFMLTSLGIVTVLFGIYLVFVAYRVLRHRRFPPPGMRVINDTKILRGRDATIYGVSALILALAVCGAGLVIPWKANEKLDKILTIKMEPIQRSPEELGIK